MKGRKPKTNVVKLHEGNPGGRGMKKTVGSDGTEPRMPEGLSDAARGMWKDVVAYLKEKGLLSKIDGVWLEIFANAYARKRMAEAVLARDGHTYETEGRNGVMIRARPEIGIVERAERQITRLLNDAAMTPSSRERMGDPSQRDLPFGNKYNDIG